MEHPFHKGDNFVIGGKEIELDEPIPEQEYLSGRCFGCDTYPSLNDTNVPVNVGSHKPFVSPAMNPTSFSSRPITGGGGENSPRYLLESEQLESGPSNKNDSEISYWICNW